MPLAVVGQHTIRYCVILGINFVKHLNLVLDFASYHIIFSYQDVTIQTDFALRGFDSEEDGLDLCLVQEYVDPTEVPLEQRRAATLVPFLSMTQARIAQQMDYVIKLLYYCIRGLFMTGNPAVYDLLRGMPLSSELSRGVYGMIMMLLVYWWSLFDFWWKSWCGLTSRLLILGAISLCNRCKIWFGILPLHG